MRRVRLVHTFRRRWRRRRRPRPRGGERLAPETEPPSQPSGPRAAVRASLPSSRRRVQKCPFHVGALHVGPVFPPYKNARFSYGSCTPPPEPARKSRCSQFISCRVPASPDSRLFQLWNSPERGGGTKMYASPIPCTPQGHHGGCRRRRDLEDPSPMKAPARPVLKDPSRVNSPMSLSQKTPVSTERSGECLRALLVESGSTADYDLMSFARPGGSWDRTEIRARGPMWDYEAPVRRSRPAICARESAG